MDSIITDERLKRHARIHEEHDVALIQEGGYIPPVPDLWEDVLIGVVLEETGPFKRPFRFRKNEASSKHFTFL